MAKSARSKKQAASEGIYCRKCMNTKHPNNFYSAIDDLLDANGYMSICISCCNDIFNNNYLSTKDLRIAILNTCRALNIAFSENALASLKSRLDGMDKKPDRVFGIYKRALAGSANVQGADFRVMTFVEPRALHDGDYKENIESSTQDDADALEYFRYTWGDNEELTLDDYEWLEEKYSEWNSTHNFDTVAQQELLKSIVWNLYDTKEARKKKEPTTGLIKEFESLLKTANLEPKDSKLGTSHETFSNIIKTIEENEPAEVFGSVRDAFKDWQNIGWYFENYVVRAIKNFLTGSRDFNIEALMDAEKDSDEIDDLMDSSSNDDGLLNYLNSEG